jgi:hypothetical protein
MLFGAHYNCLDAWGGFNCSDPANHIHVETDQVAPDALKSGAYWAPGLLATLGLIGINLVSWEAVMEEDSFNDAPCNPARIFVMFSIILLFGGLGTAIWCLVNALQEAAKDPPAWQWGGVFTFLQTLFILVAAFAFRLARRGGDHSV